MSTATNFTVFAVVGSDFHMGSGTFNARFFLDTIRKYNYRWLILNGDIYDEGAELNADEKEVVAYLKANAWRIIYIRGNHDPARISKILGIKTRRRFKLTVAGKKIVIIHGHQFDKFLFFFTEPRVDWLLAKFFAFLQWIDPNKWHCGKWMDSLHARFARHATKAAARYAKRHRRHAIVVGHNHIECAERKLLGKIRKKPIEYLNSGCWTKKVCSLVAICENGELQLHLFQMP
ncbi:MAG: metallophosphoesterase [Candidatus Staskawiczbacteria bacterium]|jgi:UDP-2,3-diacylglucosamine pyrophosphatase LpxH